MVEASLENAPAPEGQKVEQEPPAPAAPDAPPVEASAVQSQPQKRGKGRPAGSKDRVPRVVKPRIRVEPIPSKVKPEATPAEPPPEAPAPEAPSQASAVAPVEARPSAPEPPSPRTLYRQTSAQLISLRDIMLGQKRAAAAERYTAKLHAWI